MFYSLYYPPKAPNVKKKSFYSYTMQIYIFLCTVKQWRSKYVLYKQPRYRWCLYVNTQSGMLRTRVIYNTSKQNPPN